MKKDNSFQKNTMLLTAGTILNKGLQFFAVLLYSRWLSTEEYGKFDLLYTYVSLLLPIITLSTQEAIFRFSVNEKRNLVKKTYISNGLSLDIFNYFIYLFLAYWAVGKSNLPLFVIFSAYLLAELGSTYLKGFLRATERLDIYSFALVIQTVFMMIFTTVFVLILKLGLNGILVGYAAGTFAGDMILIIWGGLYKYIDITTLKINVLRQMIGYSLPLVPNEISWWVMNASDRQIINYFFGSGANGIFAIAHKIPALCSVVFNMFAISWQQEIVIRIENGEETDANSVLNNLLITLFSVCSCLLASSFIFYFYLFDNKYFEAIHYSPILIFSAMCMAVSQFYGGIQAAYKRTFNTGMTTVIGAVTNISVHLIVIRFIGLYAAAISTLFANLLIIILRALSVKDVFRAKLNFKTSVMVGVFIYFFTMAYFYHSLLLNVVNLIIGVTIAFYINRIFLRKIMTMVKR